MLNEARRRAGPAAEAVRVLRLAPDLSVPDRLAAPVKAQGEAWLAFAPEGAALHPEFDGLVAGAAIERPDVDVFYGDEAAPRDPRGPLWLKPDADPTLLRAQGYVGVPVILRARALERLGGLRADMGTAALDDLLLRAAALPLRLAAIREVLARHPGARPEPTLADRTRALAAHLAAAGRGDEIAGQAGAGGLHVRRRFADPPPVTLLIATRQARRADGRSHLADLLDSLARTSWPAERLRVIVADDLAGSPTYAAAARPYAVQRFETVRPEGAPFNYAAKANRLWRAAQTEHVVFLNDDVEVRSPHWLESLMTFATDADVGGVGARLLYPDGTLQHAGMAGGLFGAFAHPWLGQPAQAPSYGDWAVVQREWSAVTGAVFATRRSVLEMVNGFDERFALEYNDVDLCLRIGAMGLRIVQANDAELVHHEKASRGGQPPPGSQTAKFLLRWRGRIADDPAFHPGLRRDTFAVEPAPVAHAWWSAA